MSHPPALAPDLITAIESGTTIVAPSQRAAHRLRVLYANHVASQSRKAWLTPTIVSFGVLVARLWQQFGADRAVRVLTREQSMLLWKRLVDESRWSDVLLSPEAAA